MVELLRKHYDENLESGLSLVRKKGFSLLGLSFGLLVAALLVWVALGWWEFGLRQDITKLEARLAELTQEELSPPLKGAQAAARQLQALEERLGSHTLASKFLTLLEILPPARMQFLSLNASARQHTVSFSGEADNLGVLASSLERWLALPAVRSAAIPDIAQRSGRAVFRAEIGFTPSVFVTDSSSL